MAEPLLRIENLSIEFQVGAERVAAVKDLSLAIADGQTVALVGESGSGKTTASSAINRLLPENGFITAGRIFLDGRDLAEVPEGEMVRL
ncbi:MAG: ATP-binding cassette domain-containing protein, partial [Bifidobacteriaceae bacterium]|nr:ATP-binding cassette domain-containing protein [Bifidobacteriaceae bacterium]